MQGRLSKAYTFWKDTLHAPALVLDWIRTGYKLPLLCVPTPYSHRSALQHAGFVSEAIRELTANRCVTQVSVKPFICSPLSVVVNLEGKSRLVLNLKHLNQFFRKDKFKYEDLRVALLMFQKDDFLFKFDLKSGYHHVDIYEPHQKYLSFAWETEGKVSYFVFAVMPFGLSSACYTFTKLLRPLIKYWGGLGLRAVVYLDDGIVAVKGYDRAVQQSKRVRSDLASAGLIANDLKSQWIPARCIIWLGFELDLEQGWLRIPESKLQMLQNQLSKKDGLQPIPAKALASIIGKIVALSPAMGPVTRLMTCSLYSVLSSRRLWCQLLVLSPEARDELLFWQRQINLFNGQNIWPSPSAVRVVYSDASNTGYSGYCVEYGGHVAHRQWTEQEAQQSSTWRELRAVRLVLESFAKELCNQRVRWFSDNQNVVRIVLYGSRKAILQVEALAIFGVCVSSCIRLEPEWIPREENEKADFISRLVDHDDWRLNPAVFRELDRKWGPHSIDRFADMHNHQVQRFNSRYWNPGSEAVDAFTCDWSGEINWWCPPPFLIPRLLRHAQATRAAGTLVAPQWYSAPLLFPDGQHPAEFIKEAVVLPAWESLILPGT